MSALKEKYASDTYSEKERMWGELKTELLKGV
jgi:hypothetical protein